MGAAPRVAVRTIRSRDHLRTRPCLQSAACRGIRLDLHALTAVARSGGLRSSSPPDP